MKLMIVKRSLIDPDPNQPRTSHCPEEQNQLTESVRELGLLQPLIVYEESARYSLVDGYRRFITCGELGLDDVPAIVLTTKPDSDTLLLTQLAANSMRLDLRPTEKAMAYQRLKESRRLSNAELAKILHVSKSAITEIMSYLNLPGEAKSLLDSGQLAGSTAYAISRAPDEETKRELLNKAKQGELRRDDAAQRVNQTNPLTPKHRSTFRIDSFEVIVVSNDELDMASLLDLFKKLMRECRKHHGLNVKTFEHVLVDKAHNAKGIRAKVVSDKSKSPELVSEQS